MKEHLNKQEVLATQNLHIELPGVAVPEKCVLGDRYAGWNTTVQCRWFRK